mmetsp:Transcript_20499/g.34151  ORF Transcript_20499/g.34151 Transcript_20499/m.34151 type:complete len:279 (-) Transcript_20499:10-846(-)
MCRSWVISCARGAGATFGQRPLSDCNLEIPSRQTSGLKILIWKTPTIAAAASVRTPAMKTKKRQFKPSKVHVLFSVILTHSCSAFFDSGGKFARPCRNFASWSADSLPRRIFRKSTGMSSQCFDSGSASFSETFASGSPVAAFASVLVALLTPLTSFISSFVSSVSFVSFLAPLAFFVLCGPESPPVSSLTSSISSPSVSASFCSFSLSSSAAFFGVFDSLSHDVGWDEAPLKTKAAAATMPAPPATKAGSASLGTDIYVAAFAMGSARKRRATAVCV